MKTLTSTLFFLFAITIVVAQPSLKGKMMPDSNAIWVYNCADWSTYPYPPYQFRRWFSVENQDTVINSISYHKYYIGFGSIKQYFAAYRNDTTSKIVYVIPRDSTNEIKWMDFSLNLNDKRDSLLLDHSLSTFTYRDSFEVFKTDTHLILGYRVWQLNNNSFATNSNFPLTTEYIEGIGITGNGYFESGCGLQCFIHNGYYYLGQQGKCLNVGIEEQVNELKIEIYPNPITSTSTLTIDKIGEVKSVNIYDVFGRKLKEYHPANSIAINSTEFKSGIYFYSVITSRKKYSGKFLVQ